MDFEGKVIQCAEEGSRKDLADVSGVAYSGGPVSQWWSSHKLVIDLAGVWQSNASLIAVESGE